MFFFAFECSLDAHLVLGVVVGKVVFKQNNIAFLQDFFEFDLGVVKSWSGKYIFGIHAALGQSLNKAFFVCFVDNDCNVGGFGDVFAEFFVFLKLFVSKFNKSWCDNNFTARKEG